MDKAKVDRDLICVLFPGVVKNDDKAIECLGGIRNISQVYSQPTKKRLGLCYQPDNPFIKRIYADGKRTAGVVLKVKVKKTKAGGEVKREVVSTEVFGRVKKIYTFESMGDFQYLPIQIEDSGPPTCLLDKILPSGVDSFSFMSEPAPLFIVPFNFTRSDKPTNYSYTNKRYLSAHEKSDSPDRDEDVHRRIRSERGAPIVRYHFNLIDDLPTEPHEYYINRKNARMVILPELEKEYLTVKNLLDERPIVSQNMIKYQTKIKTTSLKIILPCLAIYMKNGPWRMLWLRFGYDPRKEPEARKYQTLDFRLRHQAGVHSMVMTRDQVVHYKKSDKIRHHKKRTREEEPFSYEDVCEGAVYFRPGMAPSQRQIFYQYCDVKLPEVEELIAAEPPPGFLCHQKRGWLPPNTDHVCRDHIFRYVKQALLASRNDDLKFDDGSSDGESNSDDANDDDADTASNT